MPDMDLEARIRSVFDRQQMLKTLDARLIKVSAGEVQIEMPFQRELTQQHGFIHAGAITTLIDNACGYAAYTVIPPQGSILTIEFKVNFIAPAKGEKFIAVGRAIKSGRTLTICSGEAFAIERGESKLVALMQATMMNLDK
ncbi:MAG: PaaI family thioesterase [Anaerolineales bacterium]|nr:PaaI family thioesterase [Anaerolineales bacterium]